MKAFYRFGFVFVLILTVYFTYHFTKVYYPEMTVDEKEMQSKVLTQPLENAEANTGAEESVSTEKTASTEENVNVVETASTEENANAVETASNAQILTCDTVYIIKEYDKSTKTEETVHEEIPEQYIGKTRRQIEEIVESYSQAPALKDIEKGFASMEVVSFSPEKLIVQKKYYSDLTKEHFYLVVENEYVTVYYSDLQSVYLYTDIYFSNLPQELQQEILDKKYIESEEELYNFLESYTS